MKNRQFAVRAWSPWAVAFALALGASYPGAAGAAEIKLTLSGGQEVPAVQSSASGSGSITVGEDGSVNGSVTTAGIAGTMAHIHEGAPGKNGPVVIELQKSGSGWAVPAGSKFTAAQMASYKAGDLYVNVHSDAHPKGELRAQIKP